MYDLTFGPFILSGDRVNPSGFVLLIDQIGMKGEGGKKSSLFIASNVVVVAESSTEDKRKGRGISRYSPHGDYRTVTSEFSLSDGG